MTTRVCSILLALLLWAAPIWAQAQPTLGPVNCLFSWTPPTLLADNVTPIPAGTVLSYKLYVSPMLAPTPVVGTTPATWTGTTASADCNLPGWTTTMASLAQLGTPKGQLYAWVTASMGGAESALSLPFPFMWTLAAPPPLSAPAAPTGLKAQ